MLRYRLLLGTLFVALLVALCWADAHAWLGLPPGAWLFPVAVALSAVASSELLWMWRGQDRPLAWLVYAGNLAIVASNMVPLFLLRRAEGPEAWVERLGWPAATFVGAVLVAFVGEMQRYRQPGRVVVQLALAIFAWAYVGLLLSFLVQLRMLGGNVVGMTALVSLIAVVKMGDTGAYTVGRLIGRHKMTPALSPGKTWEGAAGAMLFAVAAAWAVATWLPTGGVVASAPGGASGAAPPGFNAGWIIYGLLVAAAGLIGDLAESLIKRDTGSKDSSPWMPGFGGMLDLLDSILFAAPVAWLCWVAGLVR